MSKYLRIALLIMVGVSCVLLSLLVNASRNSGFFERYYQLLLYVNTFVASIFLVLVAILLTRLYQRARRKKYGVKILTKFALALGLTGLLPGVLIFIVSVQFLYGSVDSWFDRKVERALDSGLTLGREVLESFQSTSLNRAKNLAVELAESPPSEWVSRLDSLREREGLAEAMIVTSRGRLIGVSGASFNTLAPVVPSLKNLQTARSDGHWSGLEEKEGGAMQAKTIVLIPTIEPPTTASLSLLPNAASPRGDRFTLARGGLEASAQVGDAVFLEVVDNIPPSLAHNAEVLMNGYRDYQEMVLARGGLRSIYLISLTLVLLMSMFAAIALSVIMASRITKPLMILLEGTRRLGSGHYDLLPESKTNDEVSELTRSFNIMTTQLADARRDIEKRGEELEQAKDYLESILTKMSSGVIVVDEWWNIVSVNPSASYILKTDLPACLGMPLQEVLPDFVEPIREQIGKPVNGNYPDVSVQSEMLLKSEKKHQRLTLFTRGSPLSLGGREGYLLLFDDISSLAAAQRTEAWAEVARRLAHEIKNPLTPIQLAAERLQMKLEPKVSGKEEEILQKATRTIVTQVTAMKQMVDDFRMYAKIGSPRFEKINLAEFVQEVTNLYLAGDIHIYLNLDPTVPLIEADANMLRQVLHNLISNSMEASVKKESMRIEISVSKVCNPDTGTVEGVELEVKDNGPGFASQILEHAFEPYVTTKPSGTGLGLPMIKKIVAEHRGTVAVENIVDQAGQALGARISIIFKQLAN